MSRSTGAAKFSVRDLNGLELIFMSTFSEQVK
jgi:hypothetical protein